MPERSAQVVYDGPALESGVMDVRELAPALLSIAELFQLSQGILHGNSTDLKVNVQADFKKGSFTIDLQLALHPLAHLKSLLLGDGAKALEELAKLLGFAGGGTVTLFKLFRWLNGKKADELQTNTTNVTINNTTISVPPQLLRLYNDDEIRNAVRGIVRPLHVDGIDLFQTRENGHVIDTVRSADLTTFEVDGDDGIDDETELVLEIVKISLKRNLRWSFSDGDGSFGAYIGAYIEDEDFWNKVESGAQTFQAGDKIRVVLHTRAYRDASRKLQIDRKIPRVISLTHPDRLIQRDLDL